MNPVQRLESLAGEIEKIIMLRTPLRDGLPPVGSRGGFLPSTSMVVILRGVDAPLTFTARERELISYSGVLGRLGILPEYR